MSAALGRWYQIDVAFRNQLSALWQPLNGPIYGGMRGTKTACIRLCRQYVEPLCGLLQIVTQPRFEVPRLGFTLRFVLEIDAKPRTQNRLCSKNMLKPRYRDIH